MDGLRISIIQSDIAWENVAQNLENYLQCLLPLQGKSDLAVMPEMCTTGFSMDVAFLAELDNLQTMQTIR
jgi:predicted amidohydrolase